MSDEKYKNESLRWLNQAKNDLKASKFSLENKFYEWSCFQAQQAAEKALKSLWYFFNYDPWGHSIYKLILDFPDELIKKELINLSDNAKLLDKLYIPTRYPNGLPDLIPAEVYTQNDAENAIKSSEEIINFVEKYIK